MRKNIEIIILLGIIFFIFTTLVIFYEDKIDSMYYDNSNNYILLELKVNDLLDAAPAVKRVPKPFIRR